MTSATPVTRTMPDDHYDAIFQRSMQRLIGMTYHFGGRGRGERGIDCSSLMLRGIRDAKRLSVAELPWMTADQLAKGLNDVTVPITDPEPEHRCVLGFFDWDEDGIYEHVAARLFDGSWMWASSSVGQVVHVDEAARKTWRRQWREIESALYSPLSRLRLINWAKWPG